MSKQEESLTGGGRGDGEMVELKGHLQQEIKGSLNNHLQRMHAHDNVCQTRELTYMIDK